MERQTPMPMMSGRASAGLARKKTDFPPRAAISAFTMPWSSKTRIHTPAITAQEKRYGRYAMVCTELRTARMRTSLSASARRRESPK